MSTTTLHPGRVPEVNMLHLIGFAVKAYVAAYCVGKGWQHSGASLAGQNIDRLAQWELNERMERQQRIWEQRAAQISLNRQLARCEADDEAAFRQRALEQRAEIRGRIPQEQIAIDYANAIDATSGPLFEIETPEWLDRLH